MPCIIISHLIISKDFLEREFSFCDVPMLHVFIFSGRQESGHFLDRGSFLSEGQKQPFQSARREGGRGCPGAGDHTREHYSFSRGACTGHSALCQELETQVALGLVSEMCRGHPIGGPGRWEFSERVLPMSCSRDQLHGAWRELLNMSILTASCQHFKMMGSNCILQQLKSLVNLCSDLAAYSINNPIRGLGCWAWSPERGPSSPPYKACGLLSFFCLFLGPLLRFPG